MEMIRNHRKHLTIYPRCLWIHDQVNYN